MCTTSVVACHAGCVLCRLQGNLGHLEAASGLVAVAKAALMLSHGILLPTANFRAWRPSIDAEQLNIR